MMDYVFRTMSLQSCTDSRMQSAMQRLVNCFGELRIVGGTLDIKDAAGRNSCTAFLQALEAASATVGAEKVSRSYRSLFTVNYKALFPNEKRCYHVDILTSCLENWTMIWVNGEKFEFSSEALRRSQGLQESWSSLLRLLGTRGRRPSLDEVKEVLGALDRSWASFEEKHIEELIRIEEKARQLLVQAIQHERNLSELEAQAGGVRGRVQAPLQGTPAYEQEQRQLVGCLARINAAANTRRKGRDDLSADILTAAVRFVAGAHAGGRSQGAGLILANAIVEVYEDLRHYLRSASCALERVDPHLHNNPELVARLESWEESWEIGGNYVQNPELLSAFGDLVGELVEAQTEVPDFKGMCAECSAELFMALPRLVLLWYLADPVPREALLRMLLPLHFAARLEDGLCGGLQATQSHYDGLCRALAAELQGQDSRSILRKRAILDGFEPSSALQTQVGALMREIEGHSIEMQRHCPNDWNQFADMLLQCLEESNLAAV